MGREEGGGFRMGNTCIPVADSFWYMAKPIQYCKVKWNKIKKKKVKGKSLSRVWLFATPWTAAYQAPPSVGFSRQKYWSGVPLPSPNIAKTLALALTFIWCSDLWFCLQLQKCFTLQGNKQPALPCLIDRWYWGYLGSWSSTG